MKKIKSFILKFLVKRYGIILQRNKENYFVLKGTNVCIPFYPKTKVFLRQRFKIHKGKNVEIFIKPNDSLKNKLVRLDGSNYYYGDPFYRASIYKLEGSHLEIALCTEYLQKIFHTTPKQISFEVNFIKTK